MPDRHEDRQRTARRFPMLMGVVVAAVVLVLGLSVFMGDLTPDDGQGTYGPGELETRPPGTGSVGDGLPSDLTPGTPEPEGEAPGADGVVAGSGTDGGASADTGQ